MKPDRKIQDDVIAELQWEPVLNATEIGVAVKDGVVTLSGHVSSCTQKRQAEAAAKRVKDVKVVAIDIYVDISPGDNSSDTEIGTAIADYFKWNTLVPDEKIKIKIEDGWVTLEGDVEWQYQKEAAYNAVTFLRGIKGVSNLIMVKPAINKALIKDNIKRALERNASIRSDKVEVTTAGRTVILKGEVGSWHERSMVEMVAWASPGVVNVKDEIEVF